MKSTPFLLKRISFTFELLIYIVIGMNPVLQVQVFNCSANFLYITYFFSVKKITGSMNKRINISMF